MALVRPPARAPRPDHPLRRSSLVVAFIVALFFYDHLLELILHPYNEASEQLAREHQEPSR